MFRRIVVTALVSTVVFAPTAMAKPKRHTPQTASGVSVMVFQGEHPSCFSLEIDSYTYLRLGNEAAARGDKKGAQVYYHASDMAWAEASSIGCDWV